MQNLLRGSHTGAHIHTSSLHGHQKRSHGVILPRAESEDILDSGSKRQQANEEQQEISGFQQVKSKEHA